MNFEIDTGFCIEALLNLKLCRFNVNRLANCRELFCKL